MKKCICKECQKIFYIFPSKLGKYCSIKCSIKNLPKFKKGDNKKDANNQWKGKKVSLRNLHRYIRANFPIAIQCSYCNKNIEPLDLANRTGRYTRDINDYVYLCRSCHMKFDFERGIRRQSDETHKHRKGNGGRNVNRGSGSGNSVNNE